MDEKSQASKRARLETSPAEPSSSSSRSSSNNNNDNNNNNNNNSSSSSSSSNSGSSRVLFKPWPTSPSSPSSSSSSNASARVVNTSKRGAVSIKYNDSGSLLAVACADKRCLIVDANTGNTVTVLEGEHLLGLNDCAWLTDRLVATASDDKSIKLWDVETGKAVSTCHGHKSFVFSMNVHPENRLIYTGGYDGSVRVFHAPSSSTVMAFNAHAGAVVSIHPSPQQGLDFVTGSHDGITRIWDAASTANCKKSVFCDGVPSVSGVRYSPNGDYLLVSSMDSQVNLYPIYNTPPKFGAGAVKLYTGHTNARFNLQAAFFTSTLDNTGDTTSTGSTTSTSTSARTNRAKTTYVIQGSEDNLIYVWDASTQTVVQTLSGHSDVVLAVACNPSEAMGQFASAGRDGLLKLWCL